MSIPYLYKIKEIDKVGVHERVDRFCSRSIKDSSKEIGLNLALSMIDLTTLEGKDTANKVKQLCYKAQNLHYSNLELPSVAAVCVYPSLVRVAKKELQGSDINIASVATAFPSGQSNLNVKIDDTKYAIDEGADEVDMVISRGHFLSGELNYVSDEIAKVKEACGRAKLKVILETGELCTLDNVRKASELAMHSGADFIKTSTGKISESATPTVVLTMLEAIRDYFNNTGKKVGMKPAGGISRSKLAIQYLVMVRETLGNDWLTPDLFRFGASSLANDVLMQIVKQEQGNYQSSNYFSLD